jgi:hypothetical protein
MPVGEEMFRYHGHSGNCPKPPLMRTPEKVKPLKAFSVTFASVKGPGRSNGGEYKTACVIATGPMDAAAKAEIYQAKNWPKLFVEEILLNDNLVIM